MLQHRNGVFVGGGVMREGQAVQVKVVGFRVLGTRACLHDSTASTQRRKQVLTHLGDDAVLQSDEILGGRGQVGLPDEAVVVYVNRLQSDDQVLALLEEVSGDDGGNMQFAARFLGIDVAGGVGDA